MRKAIFLDRDGTLNVEKGYVHRIEEWEWIDGAIEAIRTFQQLGFLVVVITNQAGIARGMYCADDVETLHRHIDRMLIESGCDPISYYFCPHHPEFGEIRDCNCRKPKPGMIAQAADDLGIDLTKSLFVGDKLSDVYAGLNAQVGLNCLVKTGYGAEECEKIESNEEIYQFENLYEVVTWYKSLKEGRDDTYVGRNDHQSKWSPTYLSRAKQ